MSSVKTDVNPSDIGTRALGRERFHRLRSMLGMGTELSETRLLGKWYSGDEGLCKSLDTSVDFFLEILSATRDASRICHSLATRGGVLVEP